MLAIEDAGHWSLRALPPLLVALAALSCAADGTCFALGVRAGGSSEIVRLAGSSRSVAFVAAVPTFPKTASLSALSCPSALFCVAVGQSAAGGPIAARTADGGASWLDASLPVGAYTLTGVSCTGLRRCLAVGQQSSPSGGGLVLATVDGGATWRRLDVVAPLAAWHLEAISCWSTTCVATGTLPAGGPIAIDSHNGGALWSIAPVPMQLQSLDSVGCSGGGRCFAAGLQPDPGQPAVIASLDGGRTWTSQHVAAVRGTPGSVACSSPASCVAEAGGVLWQTTDGGGTAPQSRLSTVVLPPRPMAGQLVAIVVLVRAVPAASSSPSGTVRLDAGLAPVAGCAAQYVVPASQLLGMRSARLRRLSSEGAATCVLVWSVRGVSRLRAVYTGSAAVSSIWLEVHAHTPSFRVVSSQGGVVHGSGLPPPRLSGPANDPVVATASDFASGGYWLLRRSGQVVGVGAPAWGARPGGWHHGGAVSITGTLTGRGYAVLFADGTIEAFGDATAGFAIPRRLSAAERAVALVVAGVDSGYWLLTADGRVQGRGTTSPPPVPARADRCARDDAVGLAVSANGDGDVVACADGQLLGAGSWDGEPRAVGLERGERLVGVAANPANGSLWLATTRSRVVTVLSSGRLATGRVGLATIVAVAAA